MRFAAAQAVIETGRLDDNEGRPHQVRPQTPAAFLAWWEPHEKAVDEPIRWTNLRDAGMGIPSPTPDSLNLEICMLAERTADQPAKGLPARSHFSRFLHACPFV